MKNDLNEQSGLLSRTLAELRLYRAASQANFYYLNQPCLLQKIMDQGVLHEVDC